MSHRQFGPAGRGLEPRNIQAHRALNAHFEEEEQCRVVLRAKGEGGSSRGMQVFADCSGSGALLLQVVCQILLFGCCILSRA